MDRRRAAAALLALAACIACSAAAPTASNHTALELHDGPVEGCYYNFQHYGEGDRIMTNEPCLNCTCHNRMLMCYLRVCPFTKAIGQDCTVEKRADQCCPIVTCPDVPVDLLTSTSTSSPAEYGATGVSNLDKYGCTIHGKYFPEGAKVPSKADKPCEHCYCIRNMTACVMQECTLHVDGCTPIYHKHVCCPIRYSCDHPEDEVLLLDDMTTTVRPTPGFLLTTTTMAPVTQMSQACVHDDKIFPDGALIKTEKACEHCYCMKGDIVCVVQECGTPMENEGKNCTSLPPRHGQCCPDTYICEGDERVPDLTTEIVELTSSPPRRVGVEGSGYRNEPDEPYTEISPLTTDVEGSGEEYVTVPQLDTGDNVTPEKETSKIIDETLLTTTESSLQFSSSTEPDKGQNTIPDSVVDNETPQDKVTLSSLSTLMTTISEEYITKKDFVTRKDEISTTESIVKEDDESVSHKPSTPKDDSFKDEQTTTDFTDLLEKTTFADVEIPHKEVKEATTTQSTEHVDKTQETTKEEEISTENIVQSTTVITEKDILTDVSKTSPESVTAIESTTNLVTNPIVVESTSVYPIINEVDDNVSPNLSPSRIPGEGDCLLNGVTYSNNTNVPSTNNCHSGCKCISSIIKCDPIICSPPPEYMENMNDCEPVYDTPNSCCPTYVCSVKETVAPESHSHMSGTESPKPVIGSECLGNDCIESGGIKPPTEPIICTSGNCLSETPAIQKCESDDCKEQTEISPSVPPQDCSDGKCQLPVVPCQGEDCIKKPPTDGISDIDLQSTKSPHMQECDSDDCKDQTQAKPQDCSDGKCEVLPAAPCEGDNCKHLEPSSHDVPICNQENGCEESNVIVQDECVGESCKRKDVTEVGGKVPFKCSGSECKQHDEPNIKPDHVTEMIYEGTTVPDIGLQKTESLEPQTITSKDKLTESDTYVTKQSIFTEPPEKLSTTYEQIVTKPEKHDTDIELIQTGVPVIQTFTELPDEDVTKTEVIQPESPKLPTAETTESHDTYTHTEEQFTTEIDLSQTKQPEYVEINTEKSIDSSQTKEPEHVEKEIEKSTTLQPQISTDLHETVSDEENAESPQTSVTKSEKPVTVVPILTVTEKEGDKTEETETKPSETSDIDTESTEASVLEGTQTTLVKEKEIVHTEVPGLHNEGDEIVTTSPEFIITDKEVLQTEEPQTFTLGVDIQTKAPEIYTTERVAIETETMKVTEAEKERVQTDIPDTVTPVRDIISTESPDESTLRTTFPEFKVTTTKTIEIQEPVVTEGIQTETPDISVTKKEDDQKYLIEVATEKKVTEVSTPERQDVELEYTTTHEFNQTPMEGQTITLSPETDENDLSSATEASSVKPQITVTEVPVITNEKDEYDESHESKPIIPESRPAEGTTEIVTEHLATHISYETATEPLEYDITKMVSQPGDIVTESILYPTLSEEISKKTTKETQVVTEEQKVYTESPQEISTKSEEKDVTAGKESLYTHTPDELATKSYDIPQGVDHAVTESQEMLTKAPESSATEYFKESSVTDGDSPTQVIHEITDKQEKDTESPDIYVTTKVPELYTTLAENILTGKPYVTAPDTEKEDKDYQSTPENVEKLTTTVSNQIITERPEIHSTAPEKQKTSPDQKLDSQYPYLSTMIEEKEPEKTTDSLSVVTEIGKISTEPSVLLEDKQHDSSTKLPGDQKTTKTYEETITDKLTNQYTQELSTESPHTISQETYTKTVTDSYQETSTKAISEDEKETQDELTTTRSQTTESSEKIVDDSTLSITKKPDANVVTEKYPNTYTTKDEEEVTQFTTEKETTKSDEKLPDTSEESGLHESNLPEHTAMDSLTTQSALEISTEKEGLSDEDIDKIKKQPDELSTQVPESVTVLEHSTFGIKDRVTTEPQIVFTSSDADKVSTTILDKEIQKEQTSDNDSFLTTSPSSQPEDFKKVTESPMSLITHADNIPSSHTTLSDSEEISEQESKTTVLQKLDDEKLQTSSPETKVTELEKESTELPALHVTQQAFDTESSSKFGTDDSNILIAEKATTVMEDEYGSDVKTTIIPNQQYDLSKDVPSDEIIESTASSDTQKTAIDTSQKTTTASVPLTEKEPDFSHDQDTLITVSVDEHQTKSPHEIDTGVKDVTTVSSLLKDDNNVIETVSTEGVLPEQQGTEYPATHVYDMHTISPEKETTETEGEVITELPKLSTQKQSEGDTPIYTPIITEPTESPIPVVTEIKELDVSEKVDKPTETVLQSVETTTAHLDLEIGTEKDISHSQSVPILDITEVQYPVTQQKESSTTNVPDLFTISTQSLPELPEQEEQHGASDILDKDKVHEYLMSHGTTRIPETITLLTETQTESSSMNTVEAETPKPIDTEIKTVLPAMQSNIDKESSTTEATTVSSKGIETEVINVETHTQFTPTTSESTHIAGQTAQTNKDRDQSEEPIQTTESVHEFSETTPFLVELKEHTHQVVDESPRTPTEVIPTTSLYEPEQTERGDQNLDITDKYEDEQQTSSPIYETEHDHDDKEKIPGQDQTEHIVPTTNPPVKDFTEGISDIEAVNTTPQTDLHEHEKQQTSTIQDIVVTTSAEPEVVSEKELYTTVSTDEQKYHKTTYPAPETSSNPTEKDIHLGTEVPFKPDEPIGTTVLDDDLLQETVKPTTSKIKDITTPLPLTNKPPQPEEKPIRTTTSPSTQELTKPAFDDEINEGIPSPDFPPSGAGGYGQEPDYIEEDQAFGPGTCRYGGKVYVSAQQIPRDDPCDFCFCFRSDIICLQQSCPPPIHGCHEEPIQGFCCPRYECPVSMATTLNVTTTTTTTTTTLPPHFLPHAYKGAAQRRGCQIKGHTYKVGEVVRASSGPCLHCTCGGDGQMKCDPKACTPEPMLRQMIAAAVSAKRRR